MTSVPDRVPHKVADLNTWTVTGRIKRVSTNPTRPIQFHIETIVPNEAKDSLILRFYIGKDDKVSYSAAHDRFYVGREVTVTGSVTSSQPSPWGTWMLNLSNCHLHNDGFYLTRDNQREDLRPQEDAKDANKLPVATSAQGVTW